MNSTAPKVSASRCARAMPNGCFCRDGNKALVPCETPREAREQGRGHCRAALPGANQLTVTRASAVYWRLDPRPASTGLVVEWWEPLTIGAFCRLIRLAVTQQLARLGARALAVF